MPRNPRIHTRPWALVEVVNRTLQGMSLIKPGLRMNALIVGALAKARQDHQVKIHGGAFLSGHFHLLLSCRTVKDQAGFMRDFTRKLSLESGKLYGWNDSIFTRRYRATEISEEPAAEWGRLKYCLSHGCKENLVMSPLDWCGVAFAEALVSGDPLKGIWIDRTAFQSARGRGESCSLEDFTERLDLYLEPLPSQRHLGRSERQAVILDLIREIEQETLARHRREGTSPLGVAAVLGANPLSGPLRPKTSPKPLVHAATKKVRRMMIDALFLIVAAYRDAAERLKRGAESVAFPEGTFPPGLPFVESRGGKTGSPRAGTRSGRFVFD